MIVVPVKAIKMVVLRFIEVIPAFLIRDFTEFREEDFGKSYQVCMAFISKNHLMVVLGAIPGVRVGNLVLRKGHESNLGADTKTDFCDSLAHKKH